MSKLSIDIFTLFPEMFGGVINSSILAKAQQKGLVRFKLINFRHYATDKHQQVDDYPYGGGGGMVLKPEPLFYAVEDRIKQLSGETKPRIILTSPQGEPFTQRKADELASEKHLFFLCGHYEGFDERIRQYLATDELSIGDYVLTGGELPAMVMIDSIVRLIPGVLGNESSPKEDSFSMGLLEYPQYTRPADFRGLKVPEVLLSGHHKQIKEWRHKQSLLRTWQRRPDLIARYPLTDEEKRWLAEFEQHHKD